VNVTRLAGLLHDVGKVGIPNEILLRDPANLSAVESVALKNHCRMGEAILNPIEGWSQLAMVVLYHHERYDGTGYPTGAAGEEIPLISRIISVADSYSLMVSDKPYRAKLSPEMAKSELAANRGTQFDPLVVDAFLALLERHDDDYQRGEQVDFNVEFQKVKLFRELPPEPEEPGS
jgi:HD-GYP domain-containing protein (c-di-GMP phosphodiesterase class II)